MRRFILILGLLIVIAQNASATVDLSSLASKPHPRLLLTQADIDRMVLEWNGGSPVTQKADLYNQTKSKTDASYLNAAASSNASQANRVMMLLTCYYFTQDAAYKTAALAALNYRIENNSTWTLEDDGIYWAMACDWLWADLSSGNRTKAAQMAVSTWYPSGSFAFDAKRPYYNLAVNQAWYMAAPCLAFYGADAASDASLNLVIQEAYDRTLGTGNYAVGGSATYNGGVLPVREYYMADGGYYKGNAYGQKDFWSVVLACALSSHLGLIDMWPMADGYINGFMEYYMRIRRPDGGALRMMSGVDLYPGGQRTWDFLSWMSKLRGDRKANYYLANLGPWSSSSSRETRWMPVIFWAANSPQIDTTEMPLYRFYGADGEDNYAEGASWAEQVHIRSDWEMNNAAASTWQMTVHGIDFFGDYQNFFNLGFEIYHHGPAAIRSGLYDSGGSNGHGDHPDWYYRRAISNWCVVVESPNASNLGDRWGQDFLYDDPGQPEDIGDVANDNEYDTADITAFGVGDTTRTGLPTYYISGKLNPLSAYYYTNNDRGVEYQGRDIIVIPPHVIVRDSISCETARDMRWIGHTIHRPIMSGAETSETVAGHIETFARGNYTSQITDGDWDGEITVTALLPTGATMRRIGGGDYSFWVDDGDGAGENLYVHDMTDTLNQEAGAWRVETITSGTDVVFLHTIWTGASAATGPTWTSLSNDDVDGAYTAASNLAAIMPKDAATALTWTYTVATSGDNLDQVIAGLPDGDYTLARSGGGTTAVVSVDSLIVARNLTGGTYTLSGSSGACCYGDGTCEVVISAADCLEPGSYMGDGTVCDPNTCEDCNCDHVLESLPGDQFDIPDSWAGDTICINGQVEIGLIKSYGANNYTILGCNDGRLDGYIHIAIRGASNPYDGDNALIEDLTINSEGSGVIASADNVTIRDCKFVGAGGVFFGEGRPEAGDPDGCSIYYGAVESCSLLIPQQVGRAFFNMSGGLSFGYTVQKVRFVNNYVNIQDHLNPNETGTQGDNVWYCNFDSNTVIMNGCEDHELIKWFGSNRSTIRRNHFESYGDVDPPFASTGMSISIRSDANTNDLGAFADTIAFNWIYNDTRAMSIGAGDGHVVIGNQVFGGMADWSAPDQSAFRCDETPNLYVGSNLFVSKKGPAGSFSDSDISGSQFIGNTWSSFAAGRAAIESDHYGNATMVNNLFRMLSLTRPFIKHGNDEGGFDYVNHNGYAHVGADSGDAAPFMIYQGTTYGDLAAWLAATAFDDSSLVIGPSQPLFVDPDDDPLSYDYNLVALSPAINAGDISFIAVFDSMCVDTVRVLGSDVDLGALERDSDEFGGACCIGATGECIWAATAGACWTAGGLFSGVGTTCLPSPCAGACCLSDRTCIYVSDVECEAANGVFENWGLGCAPNPCGGGGKRAILELYDQNTGYDGGDEGP